MTNIGVYANKSACVSFRTWEGGRHNYICSICKFIPPLHLYIAPVLQNAPVVEIAVDPDWINVIFTFSEVSKYKL